MAEQRGVAVAPHARAHAVTVYADDADLMRVLAPYVAEGVLLHERVVVVITDPHRAALDEALHDLGIDSARARRSGNYLPWGAEETLRTFLVDGVLDRQRFFGTVGGLLGPSHEGAASARAFGEIVSLLWDRDQVAAALELEMLWNELGRVRPLSLLCAYATSSLTGAGLGDVGRMCELHGTLVPRSGYPDLEPPALGTWAAAADTVWSETFLPVPSAAAAARHFVTAVLTLWGEHDLTWEASLVASELATNAVQHAGSPFRASVGRARGVVRIAVEDVAAGRPERRAASSHGLDGRGVAIVEALTRRSGCDTLPEGKVVWAELAMGTTSSAALRTS